MEKELVGLLGAGLASAATGYGVAVPVGAIDRGFVLIDVLSRESGPRVGGTINRMVQSLWLEWQRSGIDRGTTGAHAGALPAIIELNRPPPHVFAAARDNPQHAGMLAGDILERARNSGDLARADLDEGIAYALIERVYQSIFAQSPVLAELMAAVDLFLQSDLWRAQEAGSVADPPLQPRQAPPPPPRPKPAISEAAREALRSIVRAHPDGSGDSERRVELLADGLSTAIAQITDLAGRTPDAATALVAASRQLTDGDFKQAEENLASAQETLIQRASMDLGKARQMMLAAAELLAIRAGLEEIRFDLRKAARHYRAATRCVPASDRAAIRQFLIRQGDALARFDRQSQDKSALTEAIRALGEAMAMAPADAAPAEVGREWLRLADLLVRQAERSGRADDFLAAADHHLSAIRNFAAVGDPMAEAASHQRAYALWRAAEISGDIAVADVAIEALRQSLAMAHRDSDPVYWVATSSRLGQTLLRVAAARTDASLLPAAIDHLRGAVQFASTCNVAIDALNTETSLGRALLGSFAAGGEPLLLDLAATAFRRAIKAAVAAGDNTAQAGLLHELGMTLWAAADNAGETRIDRGSLAGAVDALEQSMKVFDAISATAKTATVRADLTRLKTSHGAPPPL